MDAGGPHPPFSHIVVQLARLSHPNFAKSPELGGFTPSQDPHTHSSVAMVRASGAWEVSHAVRHGYLRFTHIDPRATHGYTQPATLYPCGHPGHRDPRATHGYT